MRIHGRCHCGNIAFTLVWEPDPVEIAARACSCTFCAKHSGVWTSKHDGRLEIACRDPAHRNRYSFGTRTAQFHVCSLCGVVPVATSEVDGNLYAVVNVNTFENVPASMLRITTLVLNEESEAVRLARRSRNWIADVTLVREGD